MQLPKKAAIIGAGGIACYLAPMLSKLMGIVLVDEDNYEPANSTRQFPALTSTGNKAEVLAGLLQPQTLHKVEFIPEYLRNSFITANPAWAGVEMIFGAVDNNASRRLIVELCELMELPAILAGNESDHGEAHMFLPGCYNPFDYHVFTDGEPEPWACNSDQRLESAPQTAIANMIAAGAAMHCLLSYQKVRHGRNAVVYSRSDAMTASHARAKEFLLVDKEPLLTAE